MNLPPHVSSVIASYLELEPETIYDCVNYEMSVEEVTARVEQYNAVLHFAIREMDVDPDSEWLYGEISSEDLIGMVTRLTHKV